MKASFKKNKNIFLPVVVFENNCKITYNVECVNSQMAILVADNMIKQLKYPQERFDEIEKED